MPFTIEPDDAAGMVLYLASPMSSWVTGQTLAVTGGHLTRRLAADRTESATGTSTVLPLLPGRGVGSMGTSAGLRPAGRILRRQRGRQ